MALVKSGERLGWAVTLLCVWGFLLAFTLFIAIGGTPKGKTEGVAGMAWVTVGLTTAYLLALSWRGAYLAGRARR